MKASYWRVLIAFSVLFSSSYYIGAEEPSRVEWTLDDTYQGAHQTTFNKLRYDVPILIRQTLIDLAGRTGLDYQEGWKYPLTIRFVDDTPMGTENVLAYVQMGRTLEGQLVQQLSINLTAYDRDPFDFKKVFAHELVHAMVGDALGGHSLELPVWFHEGLAVYGADQGEQMMAAYVDRFPGGSPDRFLNGLGGPHGALDYLEDYLAFKYVHDRHGVNALHNLIGEVIRREGDIPGAVSYICHEDWDTFQANAKAFAGEEIAGVSRSLERIPLHSERPTKAY